MYGQGEMYGAMNVQMGMLGLDPTMGLAMNNPNFFYFAGTSLSLHSRLESLTDEELGKIIDANINVTGVELQETSMTSYMCTLILGSLIVLPLFLMCCNWWKRCTYPAYDIPIQVYQSLGKLLRGGSLKNLTLTVVDNTFNA